jgi:hypothetical protein
MAFGCIGLEKGHYQPTTYLITDLVRMQSRGIVPGNNAVLDFIYWLIGGVSGSLPCTARDEHSLARLCCCGPLHFRTRDSWINDLVCLSVRLLVRLQTDVIFYELS